MPPRQPAEPLSIARAKKRPRKPEAPVRDDSKRSALGAVYEVISRGGIDNVSMRAVAEEAGLSTGTINYHFSNKYQLLIAALEDAYRLPDDWEQYKGSPAAQLRRLVSAYVLRGEVDRWWRFWINYAALATRDPEIQSHLRSRYERQERFWAQLILDGVESKELRAGLDAPAVACDLLIRSHGWMTRQLTMPDAATRQLANNSLNAAVDELLRRDKR